MCVCIMYVYYIYILYRPLLGDNSPWIHTVFLLSPSLLKIKTGIREN